MNMITAKRNMEIPKKNDVKTFFSSSKRAHTFSQRIRIDRGKRVTTFVWCLRKINHSLWCFNSPYCTKHMGSTVFRRANILSKKRNVPLKIPADSVYVLSKENVSVALKVVICDATLQFIIIVLASGSWLFTKTWNVSCHISFHLFCCCCCQRIISKGCTNKLAYVHCAYFERSAIDYCELLIHKGAKEMQISDSMLLLAGHWCIYMILALY